MMRRFHAKKQKNEELLFDLVKELIGRDSIVGAFFEIKVYVIRHLISNCIVQLSIINEHKMICCTGLRHEMIRYEKDMLQHTCASLGMIFACRVTFFFLTRNDTSQYIIRIGLYKS